MPIHAAMPSPNSIKDLQEALRKTQDRLSSADLELQRAHRLLDDWGLPRELPDPQTGHEIELSLAARLELIPDGEDEDEENSDEE